MAILDSATETAPLSWRQIDADERRHDSGDEPATVGLEDTDITDIAPLAPAFFRDGREAADDPGAEQRRALLMGRSTGWPPEAYASGRYVAAIAIFVVVAVVALIGITFV